MKTAMVKWFMMAAILLCMAAFVYTYNKPHRQVSNETPLLTVQAHELFTQYTSNEKAANYLYLDKVIQVQGIVGEIIQNEQGEATILLKNEATPFGISCTMQPGDQVVIKGLCTGMLMDVVLVQCVRVE